jgi:hypothetical protein
MLYLRYIRPGQVMYESRDMSSSSSTGYLINQTLRHNFFTESGNHSISLAQEFGRSPF